MAAFTVTHVNDFEGKLFTYTLTTADPNGDKFEYLQHTDVCMQAAGGTWGGATLKLQGSNDGSTWFVMNNAAGGTAISLTADGAAQAIERPRYIRPALTTVGVGASVPVLVMARKNYVK